jgi:hypothetical protein
MSRQRDLIEQQMHYMNQISGINGHETPYYSKAYFGSAQGNIGTLGGAFDQLVQKESQLNMPSQPYSTVTKKPGAIKSIVIVIAIGWLCIKLWKNRDRVEARFERLIRKLTDKLGIGD